ncbi:AI-2E family transporter [Janibacter corallicola]|uniref:AI-2E family transporter n=1 Tax=Janibacter corallicola TaxID=415212 RepID=UPI000833FFDF|nr:AI-2E family transporter [Janibacter corallicola]
MNKTADPSAERPDRGAVIGQGLVWLSRWTVRLLVVLVGAAVLLWLLGKLWVGVFPILLALIVTTLLWPPTAWLRRHGLPPALAAALVIIGGLIIFFGVLGAITPSMVSQSTDLADQASKGIAQLQERLAQPPFNLDTASINEAVGKATTWLQQQGGQIASGVFAGASAVGSGLVTLVLVLVLVFFFLKDGPKFLPFVRRVAGARPGAHFTAVATRSWDVLGGFIRTQALVSAIDAVFIGLGLVLIGVPLAFPLAVLTFFGGFIPIIGAFAIGALSVLVALVSQGLTSALLVLLLIVLVQQLEGNVLSPLLQGKTMDLHAGVILLAVTIGGTLFGIVGAFLAVPVTAVLAVVLRYLSELVDERSEEPAEVATVAEGDETDATAPGGDETRSGEQDDEASAAAEE